MDPDLPNDLFGTAAGPRSNGRLRRRLQPVFDAADRHQQTAVSTAKSRSNRMCGVMRTWIGNKLHPPTGTGYCTVQRQQNPYGGFPLLHHVRRRDHDHEPPGVSIGIYLCTRYSACAAFAFSRGSRHGQSLCRDSRDRERLSEERVFVQGQSKLERALGSQTARQPSARCSRQCFTKTTLCRQGDR